MSKTPIICRAENGRLVPIDAWGQEQIDALPRGKDLKATITTFRSHGRLGWWWAGLGLAVDNFSDDDKARWPTARKLHTAILDSLGFTEKVWRLDGTYRVEVDSIAFDAMHEEEFAAIFETARALAFKLWDYDPWQAWIDARPPKP